MSRLTAFIGVAALVFGMASAGPAMAGRDHATAPSGYARLERVIEAAELGISRPGGIAWDADAGALVVPDQQQQGRVTALSTLGASLGKRAILGLRNGSTLLYAGGGRAVVLGRHGVAHANGRSTQIRSLGGLPITITAAAQGQGIIWILDGTSSRAYGVLQDAHGLPLPGAATELDLTSLDSDLDALAVDPVTGNLYLLGVDSGNLFEITSSGANISTRDISSLGLADVQGMVIASSGDPTDQPNSTNLYIADAGALAGAGAATAGVYEVALAAPALATTMLAGAAVNDASLIQTIRTWQWSPASPDPSGLDYIPDLDRLVVADGEVEETTGAGFHGVNVWFANRQGSAQGALNTNLANPRNNEPVGAAYDPVRGDLYFAKDGSSSRVWVYRRGADGVFQQNHYFTVYQYGVADAEGLAFDGASQTLFISDGTGKEVWKVRRGADATFGTPDDVVTHFDTASLGQADPEGISFDPATGHLWIVSNNRSDGILEVTTDGVPISTTSIAAFNPNSPGGLAVAPSSTDPTRMSIWVADRGVDNNNDPRENDGLIYEFAISAGAPPPPPPPPGANVVVNGGFEEANPSGSPTGWSADGRFTRSSIQVHGGSFAGRHLAGDNSGYKITQDAPVVGGRAYAFTAWVNAPATSDAFKLLFKIQWRTNSGKLSVVTLAKVTRSTAGWVQLTATAPAPSAATTARLMMVVSSLNTTAYVDDLVLASGQ